MLTNSVNYIWNLPYLAAVIVVLLMYNLVALIVKLACVFVFPWAVTTFYACIPRVYRAVVCGCDSVASGARGVLKGVRSTGCTLLSGLGWLVGCLRGAVASGTRGVLKGVRSTGCTLLSGLGWLVGCLRGAAASGTRGVCNVLKGVRSTGCTLLSGLGWLVGCLRGAAASSARGVLKGVWSTGCTLLSGLGWLVGCLRGAVASGARGVRNRADRAFRGAWTSASEWISYGLGPCARRGYTGVMTLVDTVVCGFEWIIYKVDDYFTFLISGEPVVERPRLSDHLYSVYEEWTEYFNWYDVFLSAAFFLIPLREEFTGVAYQFAILYPPLVVFIVRRGDRREESSVPFRISDWVAAVAKNPWSAFTAPLPISWAWVAMSVLTILTLRCTGYAFVAASACMSRAVSNADGVRTMEGVYHYLALYWLFMRFCDHTASGRDVLFAYMLGSLCVTRTFPLNTHRHWATCAFHVAAIVLPPLAIATPWTQFTALVVSCAAAITCITMDSKTMDELMSADDRYMDVIHKGELLLQRKHAIYILAIAYLVYRIPVDYNVSGFVLAVFSIFFRTSMHFTGSIYRR